MKTYSQSPVFLAPYLGEPVSSVVVDCPLQRPVGVSMEVPPRRVLMQGRIVERRKQRHHLQAAVVEILPCYCSC